ncbi:MAG TPA: DUF885 domain-containing protein [Ignavibacteria bacterium]|nr:DUF885 domain-containing protein [Ignavibacteria bacterium]HRJ98300.1 DUF885 domain-containing protein [Ignavibacteria bacterium]
MLTGVNIESSPDDELLKIFSDMEEYNLRTYPEGATYNGDHRYDDRLSDNSEAAVFKYYDTLRAYMNRLKLVDYNNLSESDKLNYDLFKSSLEENLAGEKFKGYYMPMGQQWGIHIYAPQLINYQPVSTYEEYKKYFSRLRQLESKFDNTISNMRKGISEGYVMPVFLMDQTLPQIEKIIAENPEQSVFYSTLKKENKLTPEEKSLVENELKEIIVKVINPSYKKLYDFVKTEYLPACRTDAGVWALPNGKELYEYSIKSYTTLDLTADEIHNIGLSEVARIYAEMEKVKDLTGFKGSLQEFNEFLKSDPQFYYTEKEDLMNGYREILKKMDEKLPELFGILPEAKYDLFEMEEYRAASAPQAYYYSAPDDRSRPGYFYVNTYNLPSRPKYTMTALALHEAVPGHHLQIAIAQELKDLPKFRRDLGVTAFIEGWGLYAESLGYETGMYEDLYQLYGALTFEMWRACRLVVDTGIHDKMWTREQAFEYMKKYTPNSDHDLRSEVDRYISWNGQALAYKIGELKIKELRKNAEEKLGDNFDIKKFHDQILKNGAVPLPLLENIVNDWIIAELNKRNLN